MEAQSDTPACNIAAKLTEMARRQPHTPAIYFPERRESPDRVLYSHYTFAQLDEESDLLAKGLERLGIKRGTRTVLMVKPSLEFFALTFAIFKLGAVPVMVDPGIGTKSLKICLGESRPTAFIGIPKAQIARMVLGWARSTVERVITVAAPWWWMGDTLAEVRAAARSDEHRFQMADTQPDELAAILFTSGSTGVPKGVMYTHGNFMAQVEAIRETYQIQPGEIDLPTFPLFALFDPALGMSTVIPEMDFTRPADVNPSYLFQAIRDFGITNMFGSPALLDTVAREGEVQQMKLPTLRRVISAGAPVPAAVMASFSEMLSEETQIFTPYGATESLPVASIGSHQLLDPELRALTETGHGVCVGRPVDIVEARIIRIDDGPIETWVEVEEVAVGQVGEICVKGPQVTRSYFAREESTALAKIVDGEHFWHRMGDLGFFDESGALWFCGRKSHRLELESGPMFTVPCELVFNTHADVYRSALIGFEKDGRTHPVIVVETEELMDRADQKRLETELLELAKTRSHTEKIRNVLFHDDFPVDIRHNAKINRPALQQWAQGLL
jgi:acyl-CoA synthetase (AMP-forming)/AMP-acid ligase II